MSFNWEKPKTVQQKAPWEQQPNQELVLDEQAVAEIQDNPTFDVFEEEEEDAQLLMSDASLRLEQGRLYQMILANDIFGETDADPKAIRNVQREIRKFVRERMEIMLGIKQEQTVQAPVVSLPLNDMEIVALKMLASKVTGGRTEEIHTPTPVQPKKDGITSINGNLRPTPTQPMVQAPKAQSKPIQQKVQSKPQPQPTKPAAKSAVKAEESALKKPIDQMTPEELQEHNKSAEERSARNRAAMPANMVPHPTPQQLEMLYAGIAQNVGIANPWRLTNG